MDNNVQISSKRISKHNQLCWILYLSGFLDLCGVAMLLALIPSRARDSGASTTLTGMIGSVYGGVQLLSSPIMGKWADGVSRKNSILLSLVLNCIGYGTMGMSSSIIVLLVSRVISGCFKHSQTMSKAYLADAMSDQERSAVLGRFNSFSSIGMIVGPIIGGHIAESSGGFGLVAFVSSFTFALNACLVWFFIPHSEPRNISTSSLEMGENSYSTNENDESKHTLLPGKEEREMKESSRSNSLLLLTFWDLFLIIFLGSFSVILYRNNFSLLLKEKFLTSPKTMGYITSYTGLVSTLCGFSVGKITQRYKNNDAKLFLHTTFVQVFVFACLSFAPSIPVIILFLTPLSIITSIARVTTTNITIQRCGKDKMAAVMGWSQSVTSVARMIAPFVAGICQEWSMDAACYFSVMAICACLLVLVLFPQESKDRKKRED